MNSTHDTHRTAPYSLPPALDAEHRRHGDIGYYVAGSGRPLLLVHSVNAAGSAADVKPIFEHCRASRTVFAVDLPGFGSSERRDRRHTPRLMTDALHAMLAPIRERCGDGPVDVVGVSLGCEFVARAAVERPADWGKLALVSPTGFNGRKARRGAPGTTLGMPWLHAVLSQRLWADGLYRLLTRPGVVRYFLERTFGRKQIDEELWAYCVETARHPEARFAPLDFLSGNLFSADALSLYEALTQPVWATHGVVGDFTDFRWMSAVAGRPNWHFNVYPTGAMPYFELPRTFNGALDGFLGVPEPQPATIRERTRLEAA